MCDAYAREHEYACVYVRVGKIVSNSHQNVAQTRVRCPGVDRFGERLEQRRVGAPQVADQQIAQQNVNLLLVQLNKRIENDAPSERHASPGQCSCRAQPHATAHNTFASK